VPHPPPTAPPATRPRRLAPVRARLTFLLSWANEAPPAALEALAATAEGMWVESGGGGTGGGLGPAAPPPPPPLATKPTIEEL